MKRDRKRQNPQSKQASAGSIRIIAGQWRGRKLPVLDAQGLRPTTDRTKETVFNWLMHDVRDARCLDLFAGSGGLGFEALSRYAKSVHFVEKDKRVAEQLRANIATLKAPAIATQVTVNDALNYLQNCSETFDLVFLDPPFQQDLLAPILDVLTKGNVLAEQAKIYIETERSLNELPAQFGLTCQKQKNTAQVAFGVWTR
ncbi:16S rRNA (guanine(966)-N(2))-methyltransferase RsmD [Alteromonas flava]|uniref:16S rRNA (guanine(966)-N(2))-methyltransferase RsmD n=1 Tax=Alteromonas flava TaxID=2048003 RepID=UPI000C28962D|nr:16S rRNA (guanine(966)-N(2))-methyltransferase RsmD [Alteromonas flava]